LFHFEDNRFSVANTTGFDNEESLLREEFGPLVNSEMATMGMYNRRDALIKLARQQDPLLQYMAKS
jgi:hypothetical protein